MAVPVRSGFVSQLFLRVDCWLVGFRRGFVRLVGYRMYFGVHSYPTVLVVLVLKSPLLLLWGSREKRQGWSPHLVWIHFKRFREITPVNYSSRRSTWGYPCVDSRNESRAPLCSPGLVARSILHCWFIPLRERPSWYDSTYSFLLFAFLFSLI